MAAPPAWSSRAKSYLVARRSPAAIGTRVAAETVLNASNSVDASVGNLRAEIEGFLKKVAV